MRKRPILLAAAAVASGLAVFRTVGAQAPPAASTHPKVTPAGGPPALPPGYLMTKPPVPPAGSAAPPVGARPRLTTPVVAGPDGVRPVGAEVPPPTPEPPLFRPGTGAAPPGALPPPSVSQDPADPKPLPVAPAEPPTAPGVPDPRPPLVPVPPSPAGPGSVTPAPGGLPPPDAPPPTRYGGAGGDTGLSPAVVPAAGLPAKVTQTVTLEAACPESVVFGAEFRYELIVKNAGTSPVTGVRVEDELPAGAKYLGSDPPAELAADRLAWAVGTLDAGAEKRIAVRVRPADEGEVRSRATVNYAAAVEARTKVTRPRVAVAVAGPEVCKAGEEAVFQIKVNNSGTGPAQRMVLQAFLSEGMVHPQGAKLELELANLPAGETKTFPLKVAAGKSGPQWCQVTVSAQGSPDATAKASVSVVEAQLKVTQTGPARCLVRAEPVYEITLTNPGTAGTDPVTLYAVLPEGFEYVQASEGGAYSQPNRAVVWKAPGLAPGGTKAFSLKLRAAAAGDGLLRTIAQAGPEPNPQAVAGAGGVRPAGRVLEAKADTPVKAEGVAAVRFDVRVLDDPVEVGKEAQYEIRVMNQGTGACTSVQLVAALADGMAYTGSSGPTQVKAQGQTLVFEPIPTLPVKGEMVYRVKVRGTAAGDLRFRVQLTCDQVRNPVVKEESTRFVKE